MQQKEKSFWCGKEWARNKSLLRLHNGTIVNRLEQIR
jgi:hypothetical protein